MDLDKGYYDWKMATADLKWGVQKAFKAVLVAAQDGKTTLVYGSDYGPGGACLVNSVGVMLTTGGGRGVPMANFGTVVSLFDRINRELETAGVNDKPGIVSPLAADILLTHFAPEKERPPVGEDKFTVDAITLAGVETGEFDNNDEFDTIVKDLFENFEGSLEMVLSEPATTDD
jgi:hypothetical protein